ncbi:unnamed protein product [Lymnaea stagnalis]|uniref:Uncharacterized protein n=1 Tax=Lymnaea stagnalis TaxID=6523 RepID=A0AAV2HNS6_LYMST
MTCLVATMSSVLFACLLLVTIAKDVDTQTLTALEQLSQQTAPSQARGPDMMLIALCWDGQSFLDECQKHKTLMRQLLFKLLNRLKAETRLSESDVYTDDDEGQRIPSKRRRDDSRFYSNW